jgi:Transglycosylase SLT domain
MVLMRKRGELMKSRWTSRVGCAAFRYLVLASLALSGCVAVPASLTTPGIQPAAAPPPMRWDHRPEAAEWTRAALAAVATQDAVLAQSVPADIAAWCPGYETASIEHRRAFWVGLMSALAKHESTWNPAAAGGGGKWIGLMQISPKTARANGCAAQSSAALKDGSANLTCAVRIFARDVARDGLVAGKGNRGVGRQWAPFRKSAKRGDMAGWTTAQPYCAVKP